MLSEETFLEEFGKLLDFNKKGNFLLAVSGGVDSMVLLWLFGYLKSSHHISNFQVAHINYKLRGEDSDLDQKLVEDYCQKSKIPLYVYEVSERDNCPKNSSIQLWARELRYRFFREIQEKNELDYLVTAHHLNDQAETFFINLLRGSGLDGLCGIPSDENGILRPLLDFSKDEIYAFAKENDIPFREDVSNQKNDYLRNKVRNQIIPLFAKANAHFLQNFSKSHSILNETKIFVKKQIESTLTSITLKKNEKEWVLSKTMLSTKSDFEKYEILKRFGFQNSKEISKIFTAHTGSYFYSPDFSLLINREELVFINRFSSAISTPPRLSIDDNNIIIHCEAITNDNQKHISWYLDPQKIKLPLQFRKPQEGDVFFPAGMLGKKKISKYLKDEKFSRLEKENIWLLCDSNDMILGIIPYRQDRRFAVHSKEKEHIRIFFDLENSKN